MKIEIGDKVKIVNKHSVFYDQTGVVQSITKGKIYDIGVKIKTSTPMCFKDAELIKI